MFDDRLKKLRKEHGYTQQEMADILGIPQKTYCNYERNDREPTSETLRLIVEKFGVTYNYLLGLADGDYPKFDSTTTEILDIISDFTDEEKQEVKLFSEYIKYRKGK